jgi:methionyl aminopeptidase
MVVLKTESQINKIRNACRITAAYLQLVIDITSKTAGVTTNELDKLGEIFANDYGGLPAFKGYHGFPNSICASINNEVIHGIPSDKPLEEGDILSVDYGVLLDGYYSDSAITVPIGEVSYEAEKLIKIGQECLYNGIANLQKGRRLNKISHSIQIHAESNGFNVVREFVGHGLGMDLHEEPQVYNFTDKPNEGLVLEQGIVLAIEPMIVEGSNRLEVVDNGWTVRTVDKKLAAHWEHTVALTEAGPEILTLREGEDYKEN